MPKILSRGLTVISFFCPADICSCLFFTFLAPIYYFFQAFQGNMASDILKSDDFLLVPNHSHISQALINQFPEYIYAILMSIGVILATISILYELRALIKIISNLGQKKYFTAENVKLVRLFIVSQIYTLACDPFLAGANQLSTSYLGRVNNGTFNATWSNIPDDLITLIIIGVIYILFKLAEQMKRESDLTV